MEESTPATSSPNILMLILSYLFPLSLIPLFVDKSAFIQFHAKQGTVLSIVSILISVVTGIIGGLTLPLIATIGAIISLILFIFAIIAIVKGLKGEMYSIPVIGGLVGKVPTP